MSSMYEKLVTWLFETKAVRVCPQDKPFWYTSGTIGPYYINTHFLYGSEKKANDLLQVIDVEKSDISGCPGKLLELTKANYETDGTYRGLMDEMLSFIKNHMDLNQIDFISGGERRDWFFSILAAEMLGKPHITIYKDLSSVIFSGGKVESGSDLTGKKVLHIADLITEASSYERAWIPAVKKLGADIKWSVVVVDRKQGGEELLAREGVQSLAMISIDKRLFDQALSMGYINQEQYTMLLNYLKNPKEAMRQFLIENPEFLKAALNADEKTRERAMLCLEKNFYNLNAI